MFNKELKKAVAHLESRVEYLEGNEEKPIVAELTEIIPWIERRYGATSNIKSTTTVEEAIMAIINYLKLDVKHIDKVETPAKIELVKRAKK